MSTMDGVTDGFGLMSVTTSSSHSHLSTTTSLSAKATPSKQRRPHDLSPLSFSATGILSNSDYYQIKPESQSEHQSWYSRIFHKLLPSFARQRQTSASTTTVVQPLNAVSSSMLGLEERAKQLHELAERVYDQEQACCASGRLKKRPLFSLWKRNSKQKQLAAQDVMASAIQAATDSSNNKSMTLPSQSLVSRAKRKLKSKLMLRTAAAATASTSSSQSPISDLEKSLLSVTSAPPLQVVGTVAPSTTSAPVAVPKKLTKEELEEQLREKYKRIESVEERAFQILSDLGMTGSTSTNNKKKSKRNI